MDLRLGDDRIQPLIPFVARNSWNLLGRVGETECQDIVAATAQALESSIVETAAVAEAVATPVEGDERDDEEIGFDEPAGRGDGDTEFPLDKFRIRRPLAEEQRQASTLDDRNAHRRSSIADADHGGHRADFGPDGKISCDDASTRAPGKNLEKASVGDVTGFLMMRRAAQPQHGPPHVRLVARNSVHFISGALAGIRRIGGTARSTVMAVHIPHAPVPTRWAPGTTGRNLLQSQLPREFHRQLEYRHAREAQCPPAMTIGAAGPSGKPVAILLAQMRISRARGFRGTEGSHPLPVRLDNMFLQC